NTKAFYIDEKTYQMSFSAKTLLVSTEKGVYGIDPANENSSFRKIISTPQKIKKALIHNGKIWTLPESGQIGIYDANTYDEIPHFIKNIDDYLENVLYNDIIADRGKIWIASWMPKSYGITYFDEQSQLLKQVTKGDRTDQVFVGDYYNRVNRLKDGSLIFSAYGGWNIVAENGKILKSISVKDFGIAVTTNIQGIAEDDTGNIWFGCEDGLYRYSPAFGSVIRISKRDGLISNDLRYGFMMSSENQLYFATGKKVQKLDFNALQKLELFDDLKITGIRIDNQYLPDIPDRIEISEVSAQQIDIYFSVLNFWGKDKIKYRYHFGNEDWQELNNEPRLSLVKLGHGNYDITIEAYDDLDGSHRKQLSLQLHIIPPFYKTIWFIVLIGLCLCALVFSITRYLILREKKEGQLMKKIKENENKMLRSQMNPHFVFNSLNSINSFIIQKKQHEASGYLTSFSKLMRKILDNSRKDIITLKDELEATRLYLDLEAVRLDHKFDYSIRIDKNIREDEVRIPALILQPFLENAVWHGINPKSGNGFIEIAISTARDETNPCLYIKIEDNGIGRKATTYKNKETLHKSHGLAITLERLQMNDPRNKVEITDLYHENNEPTGTLVQLKIFYDND
ncbi:histidine kinase, partial [Parapedobacter defluvii]|uniref:sensor histidine kinase n=1 Tax=Parapedobacter defluvii TaxID=2045106 RepID=UPI003342CA14